MVNAIKEYGTLRELLADKKLDSHYPGLVRRLDKVDIAIPHLSRNIKLDEVLELIDMKQQFGSWGESVGGPRSAQSKKSQPTLTAEQPPDGFTYDEKRDIKRIYETAGREMPDELAGNFAGLTDMEARIALNDGHALGAQLIDSKSYPELDAWVQQTSDKLGVPKPRVIVMDSDMPRAFVQSLQRIPASIFISQDVMRLLTEPQIKAVIGHEMDHYQDAYKKSWEEKNPSSTKKRGVLTAIWDAFALPPKRKPYAEEYSADLLGGKLTSMGDMEGALLRLHFREEELAHFSDKVKDVFKQENISTESMPKYLGNLTLFKHARKHGEDKSQESYFGDYHKKDKHPPLEWRLKNLKTGQSASDGIA